MEKILGSKIAGFIASVLVVFGFAVYSAHAQTPLNVMIYTHTNDPNVKNAYINSYNAFKSIEGTNVIQRDITGMSFDQYQAQLRADMSSGENLLVYGGHGSLTDQSTDGVSFTRDYAMRAASNIAGEKGGQVTGVVESCGSGNVCGVSNLAGEGNLDGVFTAANPGDYGWVSSSNGGPWYANFGEKFKGTLEQFGTGSALDPDTNHDGVLTQGELAKALYGDNAAKRAQIKDPDKPFKFQNDDIAAKYQKFTECIILRPGQVDTSYTGSGSGAAGVTIEFKPAKISEYGNRTKFPSEFPVLGQVQDKEKSDESERNFDLRKLGSDFIEKHVQRALDTTAQTTGIKTRIVILPTSSQAKEFIQSLGGNASAQGSYTINGQKVDAGKRYLANHPSPEDKVKFDNECNPTQWTEPTFTPMPSSPPNKNGNGGNNAPQQQQAPQQQNGGLGSLLPLLLQSLLGKQNGQGNNANNGSSIGNTAPSCSSYGISPVCGSNGVTYTNSCYLQQYGLVQINTGVCKTVAPAPIASPNITSVITQLITSGAPQSVINTIINSISSIFAHENIGETVVH